MKAKDKKIIEDAERDGIPIFVLTAKDKVSLETLYDYEENCRRMGCDAKHINGIILRANEFEDWQIDNHDKVKLPD
jgi:hypothetical protein